MHVIVSTLCRGTQQRNRLLMFCRYNDSYNAIRCQLLHSVQLLLATRDRVERSSSQAKSGGVYAQSVKAERARTLCHQDPWH